MKPLSLILAMIWSSCLFAQNDTLIINNDYRFRIGVKGIYERSILFDYFSANFFNYGVQGLYRIGKKEGNNIEIGFYSLKRISDVNLISIDRSYTYLSSYQVQKLFVPIKFNKSIQLVENYFIFLSAGSYLEYLISNNFNLPQDALSPKALYDEKFVFGLIYNVGIERTINNKFSITIDIGFSHNFSSLKSYEDSNIDIANIVNPISYNYGLGIGILYKIQKK